MTTLEKVKNRLIDKILLTKDEELLSTNDNILNSKQAEDKVALNSYQIEMLMMSEMDILQGKLISETESNQQHQSITV